MGTKIDWNHPFSKQNMSALDDSKTNEKKVIMGDQEIKVLPENPIFKWIFTIFSVILIPAVAFKGVCKIIPILARTSLNGISTIAIILSLAGASFVYFEKLLPPRMDQWIKDIAKKRLSTKFIFFRGKTLYIHYDVSLKRKDIQDFVSEINDKSERFTYYLIDVQIDAYVVIVEIAKRKEIPKKCTVEPKLDTVWNLAPLGMAVNHQERDITEIGWYLNDLKAKGKEIKTLPSAHMLIAGGTGSGKSVVENGIIGHITRNADHIQACLCDVKMVEFNNLDEYKGVHQVALTIETVANLLEQMQRIMMERFKFMTKANTNDIYKVGDMNVPWFEISDGTGKTGTSITMQFDEIIPCKINRVDKLLTLDQIYEHVQSGDAVDVDTKYLVVN